MSNRSKCPICGSIDTFSFIGSGKIDFLLPQETINNKIPTPCLKIQAVRCTSCGGIQLIDSRFVATPSK